MIHLSLQQTLLASTRHWVYAKNGKCINKYTHLSHRPSKLHHFRFSGSHLSVRTTPTEQPQEQLFTPRDGKSERRWGRLGQGAGPCMRHQTWSPARVLWAPPVLLSLNHVALWLHGDFVCQTLRWLCLYWKTFTPDRSFVFLTEKNPVKLARDNLESVSQLLILHCCCRPDISQSRATMSAVWSFNNDGQEINMNKLGQRRLSPWGRRRQPRVGSVWQSPSPTHSSGFKSELRLGPAVGPGQASCPARPRLSPGPPCRTTVGKQEHRPHPERLEGHWPPGTCPCLLVPAQNVGFLAVVPCSRGTMRSAVHGRWETESGRSTEAKWQLPISWGASLGSEEQGRQSPSESWLGWGGAPTSE